MSGIHFEEWVRFIYAGPTFVEQQFQREYIRDVTASKSVWTLRTFCHGTVLSNIIFRGFLSMQACETGYALTSVTNLKL
jgi:hypothetical protein